MLVSEQQKLSKVSLNKPRANKLPQIQGLSWQSYNELQQAQKWQKSYLQWQEVKLGLRYNNLKWPQVGSKPHDEVRVKRQHLRKLLSDHLWAGISPLWLLPCFHFLCSANLSQVGCSFTVITLIWEMHQCTRLILGSVTNTYTHSSPFNILTFEGLTYHLLNTWTNIYWLVDNLFMKNLLNTGASLTFFFF